MTPAQARESGRASARCGESISRAPPFSSDELFVAWMQGLTQPELVKRRQAPLDV
jgi:hypothetical protein